MVMVHTIREVQYGTAVVAAAGLKVPLVKVRSVSNDCSPCLRTELDSRGTGFQLRAATLSNQYGTCSTHTHPGVPSIFVHLFPLFFFCKN